MSVGNNGGKLEPSRIASGNVEWKVYIQEKENKCPHKISYMNFHSNIFIIAKK